MAGRTSPGITDDTPLGPDMDLERDDVRLGDATRLNRRGR